MMFRFPMRLCLTFIITFAALSFAARALGAVQPPNGTPAGFIEGCEDQPQPCWYGIVPGVTTAEEAKLLLSRHEFRFRIAGGWRNQHFQNFEPLNRDSNCDLRFADSDDRVVAVYLSGCPGLRVGDVLTRIGTPDGVCVVNTTGFGLIYSHSGSMMVRVSHEGPFSPLSAITQIRLNPNTGSTSMMWQGFLSPDAYDQLYAPSDHTACYRE